MCQVSLVLYQMILTLIMRAALSLLYHVGISLNLLTWWKYDDLSDNNMLIYDDIKLKWWIVWLTNDTTRLYIILKRSKIM